MKTAAIVLDGRTKGNAMLRHIAELLEKQYAQRQYKTVVCNLEQGTENLQLNALVEEQKPDVLCSLDMAGFSAETLTETFYYNICTAKQMHIVLHENAWKIYQAGEFALNLYLFLPGETSKRRKAFPDVPNLYGYEAFDGSGKDQTTLDGMIETFLRDIT